jgi:rare lipoprotein A
VPLHDEGLADTGRASWYQLASMTASGERMDAGALTAAHRTLPLGSYARVENLDNGRVVLVRINDRGPFAKGRIIELSKAAAEGLGMIEKGVARVRVSPAANGGQSAAPRAKAPPSRRRPAHPPSNVMPAKAGIQ